MAKISLEKARELANNPKVRAFLDSISHAEGTTTHGYRTQFGGTAGDPFARREFTDKKGRKSTSDAYGRYQFLGRTWKDLNNRGYKLDINKPEDQDAAAVILLFDKGALDPILRGNFAKGDELAAPVWASLPGAGYDQSELSRESRKKWFENHGLGYEGSGVDYPGIAMKNIDAMYGLDNPVDANINAIQYALENSPNKSISTEIPPFLTPKQQAEYNKNMSSVAHLADGTVLIPTNKIEEKMLKEVHDSVYPDEAKDRISKAAAMAINMSPKDVFTTDFSAKDAFKSEDGLVHKILKGLF